MKRNNSLPTLLFVVIVVLGAALAYALYGREPGAGNVTIIGIAVLVACIAASASKVATPWHRVVVLRLGRFHGLRGPGIFGIIDAGASAARLISAEHMLRGTPFAS